MREPNKLQKKILDALTKYAEENNLEIITKTIHFDNDDVPEFLKKLKEFKRKSRESSFIVKYNSPEPIQPYSAQIPIYNP